MKIALISDIHGNYPALKKVLDELDKMSVDTIYCLGDVTGYYTQINECCEELRKRCIKSIMGNHDWYLVSNGFCPRFRAADDCIQYQKKIITQENLKWLSSNPMFLKVENLHMVHGGWGNPIDEYLYPTEEYFSKISGKYFASGHTHVQNVTKFSSKIYCNPGSVGQPRDHDRRAAFAIFDGENFKLHRVEYETSEVFLLMEKAGFSDYYYNCLKTGAQKLGK